MATSRFYSTSKQEIRAKAAVGVSFLSVDKTTVILIYYYYQPFTYKAAAVFLGVGAGLLLYFKSEKEKVNKIRKYCLMII
jgi:protein SCO1/2